MSSVAKPSEKVVGVVQARVGSTRLPNKVLLPLAGRPLLERMLERLSRCKELDELVVATTTLAGDRSLVALAASLGVRCVAGHATDLIDRHLSAARMTGADVVVKIPSDCPLIDPRIVDRVIEFFRRAEGRLDYASNLHPASWPDGNDVEVFTRDVLELAYREAQRPYEREHTTPFIWDQPERFRLGNVSWDRGRDLSRSHRLVVDHPEDLEVVSAVYQALKNQSSEPFSVEEIVDFLERNPYVREHNARHRNTGWPSDHARELRTRGNVAPSRYDERPGEMSGEAPT